MYHLPKHFYQTLRSPSIVSRLPERLIRPKNAKESFIRLLRTSTITATPHENRGFDRPYNVIPASSSARARAISPNLPPRTSSCMRSPSVPSSPNVSASNEVQRNISPGQNSTEKRKRAPLVVSSYYLPVWVLKHGTETTMIQKRMCRRCKVDVQFKSASLLIHTANCRFTSLVSKKMPSNNQGTKRCRR